MDADRQFYKQDALSSQALWFYLLYRLALGLLLLGIFLSKLAPDIFGSVHDKLYFYTAAIYLLITTIDLAISNSERYRLGTTHLLFILLTDITVQTLLMHASGGLPSGIGYLMLVTVAVGSIFFTGQLAILVAAVASIGIIVESASTLFLSPELRSTMFPAGLLGILLFLTSLIVQGLNRALRKAERVATLESAQSAQLQELNELIISRMLTGILVVDAAGNIELINQAAVQLLGGNRPEAPFKRGDNIRGEPSLATQLRNWSKFSWLRANPFIPRFGNTEVQASFKHTDQSDKKRIMIFLEDSRAATQHAQQLKLASLGRLTGSIAHEIRNPLGAISHASQLLAEFRDHDDATTRLTDIIAKQVRRVNLIVENVLQLSRRQEHNFQKIDLPTWLQGFVDEYLETSRQRPEIGLDISANIITTTFDPSHLQQVLTNLLDNAVRYSRLTSGTPWAGLRVRLGGVDKLPTIDVLDLGPGVAEQDRNKLFEPFFTTSSEGSGLGLYIARELCEINYATLKYEPPEGTEGGFFRISFAHPGKILERSDHD